MKYCKHSVVVSTTNPRKDGGMFPVISNQKYNKYLKEIGALADLQGEWVDTEYRKNEKVERRTPKRDLESHTARRTFVCIAAFYDEGKFYASNIHVILGRLDKVIREGRSAK